MALFLFFVVFLGSSKAARASNLLHKLTKRGGIIASSWHHLSGILHSSTCSLGLDPTTIVCYYCSHTFSCHSKIYNALCINVISIEQRCKKCMKDVRKICTMQSFSTPFMHSIHLCWTHITLMSNYDTIVGWLMSRTWYSADN
jgi:hypothetical protein